MSVILDYVSGFPIAPERLPLGGSTGSQKALGSEGHLKYIRSAEHLMKRHRKRWVQIGAGWKTRRTDLDHWMNGDQKRPKRGWVSQKQGIGDDRGSLVREEKQCRRMRSRVWS